MSRILGVALASLALVACGSRLTSVDPKRGGPGEVFTITGTNLDWLDSPPPEAPRMVRCEEFSLEVVEWQPNSVRVRIPANVPAGVYRVHGFGRPSGAYERHRTNSLDFWVTAAPVPLSVTDPYEVQMKSFRTRYGKGVMWEAWMLANRDRYAPVFAAAHALPCPLGIAVSYESPLPYNPPWSSESEHMKALNAYAEPNFPGYHFDFRFGADPGATYGHAVLGHVGTSYADYRTVYLHYETIFGHEFGHVLNVLHHYTDGDEDRTMGKGLHFPPFERGCIMDRNEEQYCSACRAALNLPLDVDHDSAISLSGNEILRRYPPGW